MRIKKVRKKSKRRTFITKAKFRKALEGTGGILSRVAERLGCNPNTMYNWAKKHKDDPEVQEWIENEKNVLADTAEDTIKTMMQQRLDFSVASRTAKWYLERKHPERGYRENKTMTLEGGQTPIHVKNENILPIESLDLPLDVRKQLLAAIEEKENEKGKE